MALRRHIFFVSEDDTARRFPTARYDRLWADSSARLPEYANQRVRTAEVVVECVARSPVSMGDDPDILTIPQKGGFFSQ